MKNSYFQKTKTDLARYITERNNVFNSIVMDVPGELIRISAIGARYDVTFRGIRTEVKYNINVFIDEDFIRIVIPAHSYDVTTEDIDYAGNILVFTFKFPQTCIEKELLLDQYLDKFNAVDEEIDIIIQQQINAEINKIFSNEPTVLKLFTAEDSRTSWCLKSQQRPSIQYIESEYLICC